MGRQHRLVQLEKAHIVAQHLHIVAAPCEEAGILAAPLDKARKNLAEAGRSVELFLCDAGQKADALLQSFIILGTDIGLECADLSQVFVQHDGADLDYLALEGHGTDDDTLGAGRIIPLHVEHDISHKQLR